MRRRVRAASPDAVAADPSPDQDDWHEPILQELAEIGLEVARVLLRREAARAVDDEAAGPDPQLAFARVPRAVRQTVALNAYLRQQQRQAVDAKAAASHGDAAPEGSMQADRANYERVKARMEALLHKSEAAKDDAERLLGDLDQRLDVAVNTAGFADRPIDEVVAEIRYALGLGPKPAAAKVAGDDDQGPDEEGPDDQDLGAEDRDDDESGRSAERRAEPPWLEPGWAAAQDRPRRGSG